MCQCLVANIWFTGLRGKLLCGLDEQSPAAAVSTGVVFLRLSTGHSSGCPEAPVRRGMHVKYSLKVFLSPCLI